MKRSIIAPGLVVGLLALSLVPGLSGCEDESSTGGAASFDGGGFSLPDAASSSSFSISGTVTGLTGKGLVMRESVSGQTVAVGAGAFAFAGRVAPGAAYDVRVESAPSEPFQVCVVERGTGAVVGADITDVAVACLPPLPSGALDPSFGTAGKVSLPGHLPAKALAMQADGKLLVIENLNLWRYLPDGSPDPTFGPTGSSGSVLLRVGTTTDVWESVTVQPDGKILVAGSSRASALAKTDFAVLRLDTNGAADTSFGGTGAVTTDFSGETDRASAVLVQPDGAILVAGAAQMPVTGGFFGNDYALVRYLPNGTPDPGFGSGGKVTTNIGGATDLGSAVALQADGKIVLVGRVADRGGDDPDFGVVRYLANGTPDLGFGAGGIARIDYGIDGWDEATDVAVQPDGKIVVGGFAAVAGDDRFTVARLKADGTRDEGFGTLGVTVTPFSTQDDFARALALQADGKILLAGQFANLGPGAASNFGVMRFTATGALDPSFGEGGRVQVDFFAGSDDASAIVIDGAGRIVVGGSVLTGGRAQLGLVRLMP